MEIGQKYQNYATKLSLAHDSPTHELQQAHICQNIIKSNPQNVKRVKNGTCIFADAELELQLDILSCKYQEGTGRWY